MIIIIIIAVVIITCYLKNISIQKNANCTLVHSHTADVLKATAIVRLRRASFVSAH